MPSQEEKQAAVSKAAEAFGMLEAALESDKKAAERVIANIERCYEKGVGTQTEFLTIANDLESLKGEIAASLAKLLRIHNTATKIAKRCECDVPGGYAIDGGVVSPMGGTR